MNRIQSLLSALAACLLVLGSAPPWNESRIDAGQARLIYGSARDEISLQEAGALLLSLVNEERLSHGLGRLEPLALAGRLAQEHAAEMAQHHYFNHYSLAGLKCEERWNALGGTDQVSENITYYGALHGLPRAQRESRADELIERDPTVRYYAMGAVGEEGAPGNDWRTAADWPLKTVESAYYLQAGGGLMLHAPETADSATEFLADPVHPNSIPGRGFPGAADARDFVQGRPQRGGAPSAAVKGQGEAVGLVPHPLEEQQRIRVASERNRVGPPGHEDLVLRFPASLVLLGDPDHVEPPLQAEVPHHGQRDPQLSAPAVHHQQVRQHRAPFPRVPVAPA